MELCGLIDEDIVNYKKTSMYLAFPHCSFKCNKECGEEVCQNLSLSCAQKIEITPDALCERYVDNPITRAVVCGGLEPFDSKYDLISFIDCLRRKYNCRDDIVIYTGYTEEELSCSEGVLNTIYENILQYPNIIVKFGRFIPYEETHYDEVLGVRLVSPNQYAKKVS